MPKAKQQPALSRDEQAELCKKRIAGLMPFSEPIGSGVSHARAELAYLHEDLARGALFYQNPEPWRFPLAAALYSEERLSEARRTMLARLRSLRDDLAEAAATFDRPGYRGTSSFGLVQGQGPQLDIACAIANHAAQECQEAWRRARRFHLPDEYLTDFARRIPGMLS